MVSASSFRTKVIINATAFIQVNTVFAISVYVNLDWLSVLDF